jgi:hypothetical protein
MCQTCKLVFLLYSTFLAVTLAYTYHSVIVVLYSLLHQLQTLSSRPEEMFSYNYTIPATYHYRQVTHGGGLACFSERRSELHRHPFVLLRC